jgi:hypothetical protein
MISPTALNAFIEKSQTLNREMLADLPAFFHGKLSEKEVLQRGALRQIERRWLDFRFNPPDKKPN